MPEGIVCGVWGEIKIPSVFIMITATASAHTHKNITNIHHPHLADERNKRMKEADV
jgi:hypothetical protein